MEQKKFLYSTGAFAKMNGINKRTLHYYDDIGLFSPEYKADNGYRYYTCFQTAQLEMILILRSVGLSIDEIRQYTQNPSGESFENMVRERKELLDRSLRQLMEVRQFLQRKVEKLSLGATARHGSIERIVLPEQQMLLSDSISGSYDSGDFSIAADFSQRLKALFGLYDNFGSRISVDSIMKKEYSNYDCFFTAGGEKEGYWDEIRPGGTFLRTYCIGRWETIPEVYQMLCSYARDNQLELYGYAYEEGLNEMSLKNREDYITMITVPYRENINRQENINKQKGMD